MSSVGPQFPTSPTVVPLARGDRSPIPEQENVYPELVKITIKPIHMPHRRWAPSPESARGKADGGCRTARHRPAPPDTADVAIAAEVLASLPARERDALIGFYLEQQESNAILARYGFSDAEWRSVKTRARELFRAGRSAARRTGAECVGPDLAQS